MATASASRHSRSRSMTFLSFNSGPVEPLPSPTTKKLNGNRIPNIRKVIKEYKQEKIVLSGEIAFKVVNFNFSDEEVDDDATRSGVAYGRDAAEESLEGSRFSPQSSSPLNRNHHSPPHEEVSPTVLENLKKSHKFQLKYDFHHSHSHNDAGREEERPRPFRLPLAPKHVAAPAAGAWFPGKSSSKQARSPEPSHERYGSKPTRSPEHSHERYGSKPTRSPEHSHERYGSKPARSPESSSERYGSKPARSPTHSHDRFDSRQARSPKSTHERSRSLYHINSFPDLNHNPDPPQPPPSRIPLPPNARRSRHARSASWSGANGANATPDFDFAALAQGDDWMKAENRQERCPSVSEAGEPDQEEKTETETETIPTLKPLLPPPGSPLNRKKIAALIDKLVGRGDILPPPPAARPAAQKMYFGSLGRRAGKHMLPEDYIQDGGFMYGKKKATEELTTMPSLTTLQCKDEFYGEGDSSIPLAAPLAPG